MENISTYEVQMVMKLVGQTVSYPPKETKDKILKLTSAEIEKIKRGELTITIPQDSQTTFTEKLTGLLTEIGIAKYDPLVNGSLLTHVLTGLENRTLFENAKIKYPILKVPDELAREVKKYPWN